MFKHIYNWYYRHFPPEMVSWWKTKEAVRAKVTEAKDGSYIMMMEGEKYPFPGYPRGRLLYGTLSKLKHEIKNQIFNDSWGKENPDIEQALKNIYALAEKSKNDVMPYHKMAPAVRAVYDATPHPVWKMILGYIFQEDDAYRWRFQWMSKYLDKKDPIGSFDRAMRMMEHAEVVGDMKERINLIRVVMLELWKNPEYKRSWEEFMQNIDLKKVKLTKADKYFFRAKYFKVDFPNYEY